MERGRRQRTRKEKQHDLLHTQTCSAYLRVHIRPSRTIILLGTIVARTRIQRLFASYATGRGSGRGPVRHPLGQGREFWRGLPTATAQIIAPAWRRD